MNNKSDHCIKSNVLLLFVKAVQAVEVHLQKPVSPCSFRYASPETVKGLAASIFRKDIAYSVEIFRRSIRLMENKKISFILQYSGTEYSAPVKNPLVHEPQQLHHPAGKKQTDGLH